LFLDEVGELPLNLQAQLLRVLQDGTYKRVGGNTWQQTNFRLVAATNKNLLEAVMRGTFRNDLYYRIASIVCQLPPLRERPEDILQLLRHFTRQSRPDKQPLELDDFVQRYFLTRPYPGNVRDLKQLVARIIYRHVETGPITLGDIPDEECFLAAPPADWCDDSLERAMRRALTLGVGLKEIGCVVTDTAIRIAVDDAEGHLQRAARQLGVSDRALQMRRAACRSQQREESEVSAPESATKALISAAHSAIPGGKIAQMGFDVAMNVARGKNLSESALSTLRAQLPGGLAAQAAFNTDLVVAQGKKLQDAAFAAAGRVLPPSPFAADALSFARAVASGKNIQHVALSIVGQRVLQGQKVYQKSRNMKRELHFG
jgi:hypothetical protein